MPRPAVGTPIRSTPLRSATGTAGSGPATPGRASDGELRPSSPSLRTANRRTVSLRTASLRTASLRSRIRTGSLRRGRAPTSNRRIRLSPTAQRRTPPATPPPGTKQALTADGVPLSGWWWRVLAMLIDGLIVGIIAAAAELPDLRPALRPLRRVLQRDRRGHRGRTAAATAAVAHRAGPVHGPADLDRCRPGRRGGLHRAVPALAVSDPRQADLRSARGAGRPGPVPRAAGLEHDRHPDGGVGVAQPVGLSADLPPARRAVPALAAQATGPARPGRRRPRWSRSGSC